MLYSSVITFALAALLIVTSGCDELAKNIADNAPFAKPPEIIKVGARNWDGDPVYYNSGGAFEFIVKHGLANELIIRENGTDLPRVSSPPAPGTQTSAVYWRVADLANDTTAQRATARIRIFTKESLASGTFVPPADGTQRTYSFIEKSINPRATGKDLQSDPTDVKITIWRRQPVIAVFTTSPENPAANIPLSVEWRANDAKKIELLERVLVTNQDGSTEERESVIESKVFNPGPAGSLNGMRSLTVSQNTKGIALRVYGAGGGVITDVKEVSVSGPVPCPQNPNGRKNWYVFCLECTGRPPERVDERGCTEEEAFALSNKWYKSEFCEVKNRACYAPGDPGGPDSSSPTPSSSPTETP